MIKASFPHDRLRRARSDFFASDESAAAIMCFGYEMSRSRQSGYSWLFAVYDRWPGFWDGSWLFFCCAPLHQSRHFCANCHKCREFRIVLKLGGHSVSGSLFAAKSHIVFDRRTALGVLSGMGLSRVVSKLPALGSTEESPAQNPDRGMRPRSPHFPDTQFAAG